jgi:bifunctional DNase/RNase
MIEVSIGGLIPDKKGETQILLLKVPGKGRYLPIWIGLHEAQAIAMAINGQTFDRPLTHDLLKSVIDGLDAQVTRVVITTIQGNTFFARIFLARGNEIISIDARPSDSVALAVRADCPIYLTEELLDSQADNLYHFEEPAQSSPLDGTPEDLEELLRRVEMGDADFESESGEDEPTDPD